MTDVSEKVLAAFQVEHREYLERLRSFLAEGCDGAAGGSRPAVEEAFRLAHSLKGGARVCGLREVEALGHHMESVLSRVREGVRSLDGEVREALRGGLDAIEDWMSVLALRSGGDPTPTVRAAVARLAGVMGSGESAASPPAVSGNAVSEPEAGILPNATAEKCAPGAQEDRQTIRIRAESLDGILNLAQEMTLELDRLAHLGAGLEMLNARVGDWSRERETVRRLSGAALNRLGSRPEYKRIAAHFEYTDRQVRFISREVVRMRALQARSHCAMCSAGERLQRDVQSARMVSIQGAFDGFHKMVRDLARDDGKQAELNVTGPDVAADRLVVERVKDPVMHLLRNAVVHGIEPPEVRLSRGKSATGQVRLEVGTQSNRWTIRVWDDGHGVDYGSAEQAARRRGWSPKTGDALGTREELNRWLFLPGFTTKGSVDYLAGRGMGLSVVRETVDRLQGGVRMESVSGRGTTVEIDLPLTLARHPLLCVVEAGLVFGIPVHAVRRVLRLKGARIAKIEGRTEIDMGGATAPLSRLAETAGIEGWVERAGDGAAESVVVIQGASSCVAAIVDRVLEVRAAVVREIRGSAGRMEAICGGFQLEGGGVGLVLNPAGIEFRRNAVEAADASPGSPRAHEPGTPAILIVDDSFTTRTLERSILETHGYHVLVAVDGLDALRQLSVERVDLVIADVQMPRMDGFQLLAGMKRDDSLKSIPVILVTSLDQPADRELGLKLGADAYLIKQRFDHEHLLETILRFVDPPPGEQGAIPAPAGLTGGGG